MEHESEAEVERGDDAEASEAEVPRAGGGGVAVVERGSTAELERGGWRRRCPPLGTAVTESSGCLARLVASSLGRIRLMVRHTTFHPACRWIRLDVRFRSFGSDTLCLLK